MDVTGKVNTTNLDDTARAVRNIYKNIFPDKSFTNIDTAFTKVGELFRGENPDFEASNTPYHGLEHSLDAGLGAARALVGMHMVYPDLVNAEEFELGVISELDHDTGYMQDKGDTDGTGAKNHTKDHPKRSAKRLKEDLSEFFSEDKIILMQKYIGTTHFYEDSTEIEFDSGIHRAIGFVMEAIDFIVQMSDEHYIDKLSNLFAEFQEAGIDVYDNVEKLIADTPNFFKKNVSMVPGYYMAMAYLSIFFKGKENPYQIGIQRNLDRIEQTVKSGELATVKH